MALDSQPPGNNPPRKPWEQAGTSSGPSTQFKPPSAGSTSDVVEAYGTAKPGEIVSSANTSITANVNPALSRVMPSRPWQQNYGTSHGGYGSNMHYNTSYGSNMNYSTGYGSNMNYSTGYGSGMYGYGYGGLGGTYGGGLYGNSMYGGFGGGGLYNSSLGGQMGGYGMGTGGPYGGQDPNDPHGPPPSPPGFWVSFLRVMQGVVSFFSRIAILVDQNTQAFHMFMSALLQLFDRSGVLYGELARFVLRILGIKTKYRKQVKPGPGELPGPSGRGEHFLEGPKAAGNRSWDNVWGEDD